jgi:hypothetical protein
MFTQEEFAVIAQKNEAERILAEFAKTLLPARLITEGETGVRNGNILAIELQKRNLTLTVPNLVRITNEVLFQNRLEWVPGCEPAKFAARKEHEAKMNQSVAKNATDDFTARLRKSEAADAKAKADEASIRQAKNIIAAFTPTKNTSRGTAIDYARQANVQQALTKALDNAIQKKANLQAFAQWVSDEVARMYEAEARSNERL